MGRHVQNSALDPADLEPETFCTESPISCLFVHRDKKA